MGKVDEKLLEKYKDVKEKRHEAIMADPAFPAGCIIMPDHVSIWKPHIYRTEINHYRRLKRAFAAEGIAGVNKYLAAIKQQQEQRRKRVEAEKQIKADLQKLEHGTTSDNKPERVQPVAGPAEATAE